MLTRRSCLEGTDASELLAVLFAEEVKCEFNTHTAANDTTVCTRFLRVVDANRNELSAPAWEAEISTSKRGTRTQFVKVSGSFTHESLLCARLERSREYVVCTGLSLFF